jgi:hypothetical protein
VRTKVELGLVFEREVVDRGQHRDDALRGLGLDALHADQPSVVFAHARDVDPSAGEVEVLAVEQAELADPQPSGHQRGEQHDTRNVIAIALRLGGPHLAPADLGDEAVGDVISARQGDIRRGARADGVNVVPRQPAMFALEQRASVEQSRDLKGLEEAARGTGLTNERLRVRGNVALNDAVAHRVLQDRTHGPDDLVDR